MKYVRNESEDELKAESFLAIFRAQRALTPRLAAYGQYGYQRDRFAGILNRNAVEGGLAYTLVDRSPHKLVVDGGLGLSLRDPQAYIQSYEERLPAARGLMARGVRLIATTLRPWRRVRPRSRGRRSGSWCCPTPG